MDDAFQFAVLSQGRLYVKTDKGVREIESAFAQNLIDREARDRERNKWKENSTGWQMRAADEGMPWMNPNGGMATGRRIHITSVTAATQGMILYTLDTDTVGGLFEYTLDEREERRLVHHHEFRVRDLHRHATEPIIACSVQHDDLITNLGTIPDGGGKVTELTEGDSVDEAPSWIGNEKSLVFQSAGIGRDAVGMPFGVGPYRIERIDVNEGRIATLVEYEQFDCLQPRMSADGTLFYIRRPYVPPGGASRNPLQLVGDVVLYPFRLLRAVGAFFNFMSMTFAGKPLTTAGGPKREGPDMRKVMLWGRWVDIKKAERAAAGKKTGALVPKSWELVRVDRNNDETILARNVVAYDLSPDGQIAYTNGNNVYLDQGDGQPKSVLKQKLAERVVFIGTAGPAQANAPVNEQS